MTAPQKITLYLLPHYCFEQRGFAQVINIPDPNLHSAIRESLNLPPDVPLTRSAILGLTRLDVAKRGIVNLTGLEHATSLIFLVLITTIFPIYARCQPCKSNFCTPSRQSNK